MASMATGATVYGANGKRPSAGTAPLSLKIKMGTKTQPKIA